MRSGSLFSGAAGLDLAVTDVMGCEPAWFCDNDPAATRVLQHHYPSTPNHDDITTVNWAQVEPVDLVTAGWPCQPWSQAGKRKGAEDERALWPEAARALRVLRPQYVLLENVPAVITAGELQRAASDLATFGYEFAWTVLGANEIGACHRRNRVFILAVANGVASNSKGDGRDEGWAEPAWFQRGSDAALGGSAAPADPAGPRWPGHIPGDSLTGHRATSNGAGETEPGGLRGVAPAAGGFEPVRSGVPQGRGIGLVDNGCIDWGVYRPAIERWGSVLGRPAPVPTIRGARGGRKLNPALPEWMQGFPAGWITDVPRVSVNDALRLAGNSVNPYQGAAALRWLLAQLETEAAA